MGPLFKSIAEIWKSLTAGQRVTLAGTGMLTAALVGLVVWWSQKPSLSLLYGGLDTSEAAKISDELRDQKIPFEIGNGGKAIYVPGGLVYELRLKLASKGIPRAGGGSNGVGFEIFDKPTFGLSDFLQKANYYRALQGELSRTISQMEEVETARVLLVAPNERLFAQEKGEVKASVFVQLRGQMRLGRQQVNAIRFLVANGVEGLKPNRVAIVDNTGTVLAENEEETSAGLSASQIEVRKNAEGLYVTKLQSMLDQVLGAGQSVVRVSVDMNFDTLQQTEERFDPATAVIRNESTTTEEATNPIRSSSGAPGISGNSSNQVEVAQSQVLTGTSKKQNSSNQYEISKLVQNTIKGAGEIKKISVAVFVNQKKEGEGADAKVVPRTPEEKALLVNVIKRAVGFVEEGKGKRNDELALEEISFYSNPAAEVGAVKGPSMGERVTSWLPALGKIALVLLAFGLLYYFKTLLATVKSDSLRTDLSLDSMGGVEKGGAATGLNGAPITVGDLSKLIRENPNNMSQALKAWMSQS